MTERVEEAGTTSNYCHDDSATGNIAVSHYASVPKKLKALVHPVATWCFRTFASHREFVVRGRSHRYFYHPYNNTYAGERCVEIPLVLSLLADTSDPALLEVGNVLRHYTDRKHDVVDKYEPSPDVIACDILDYRPSKSYQAIVSISTLEHIGWDEPLKDPEKPARVLDHLRSMLQPGGRMIITAPTGYNPAIDQGFSTGRFQFDDVIALRRESFSTWRECKLGEGLTCKFGNPYPYGNGVIVGLVG